MELFGVNRTYGFFNSHSKPDIHPAVLLGAGVFCLMNTSAFIVTAGVVFTACSLPLMHEGITYIWRTKAWKGTAGAVVCVAAIFGSPWQVLAAGGGAYCGWMGAEIRRLMIK